MTGSGLAVADLFSLRGFRPAARKGKRRGAASRLRGAFLAVAMVSGAAPSALAEPDFFSADLFHGDIDLRGALTDGEPSWLERGLGKARFGGSGAFESHAALADARFVWEPQLTSTLTGHFHIQAAQEQNPALGPVESYLQWHPIPVSSTRYSFRAGLMYPPVSLEHDGPGWSPSRTITPSAITSWIAEEVSLVGVEGTVRHEFETQTLQLTVATFGFDDTSGALLAFRGWALHDRRIVANGSFPLPDIGPSFRVLLPKQAANTVPNSEVSGQPGIYGRIGWEPEWPFELELFGYDNRGTATGLRDGQYSWATRFVDLGATVYLDDETELLLQGLEGESAMGKPVSGGRLYDFDFRSAYLLVSHRRGGGRVSARAEYFDIRQHTSSQLFDINEHGWALTGAYKYRPVDHIELAWEVLYVQSARGARTLLGESPRQSQTTLQTSMKFMF